MSHREESRPDQQQPAQLNLPSTPSDALIEVAALVFHASRDTPINGAVVYSGVGESGLPNRLAAEAFVRDNPGYMMLSSTQMGKVLNKAIFDTHADRLTKDEKTLLGALASYLFVQNARGQVQQFTDGAPHDGIYLNIELHMLVENARVTEGVERDPKNGQPLFIQTKGAMTAREEAVPALDHKIDALVDRARVSIDRQFAINGMAMTVQPANAVQPRFKEAAAEITGSRQAAWQAPLIEGLPRSTARNPLGDAANRASTASVMTVRTLGWGVLKSIGSLFALLGGFAMGRSSEGREESRSLDEMRRDQYASGEYRGYEG